MLKWNETKVMTCLEAEPKRNEEKPGLSYGYTVHNHDLIKENPSMRETAHPPTLPNIKRAALIAPLIPIPFVVIVYAIQSYSVNLIAVFSIARFIQSLGLTIVFGSLIAYPVALLLFMPQHFLLARYGLTGYWHYSLIGLTSGLLATAFLFFYYQHQVTIPFTLIDYLSLFLSCLIAALSFRFIAGYSRETGG